MRTSVSATRKRREQHRGRAESAGAGGWGSVVKCHLLDRTWPWPSYSQTPEAYGPLSKVRRPVGQSAAS